MAITGSSTFARLIRTGGEPHVVRIHGVEELLHLPDRRELLEHQRPLEVTLVHLSPVCALTTGRISQLSVYASERDGRVRKAARASMAMPTVTYASATLKTGQ